jgi:hypothetical protein
VRSVGYAKAWQLLSGAEPVPGVKKLDITAERLVTLSQHADLTIDFVTMNMQRYLQESLEKEINVVKSLENLKSGEKYRSYNRQYEVLLEHVRPSERSAA